MMFEGEFQCGCSQHWLDAPLHGIAIDVIRGCKRGEGGWRGGEALPSSSYINPCDPPDHAQFRNGLAIPKNQEMSPHEIKGHNVRETGPNEIRPI